MKRGFSVYASCLVNLTVTTDYIGEAQNKKSRSIIHEAAFCFLLALWYRMIGLAWVGKKYFKLVCAEEPVKMD